MRHLQIVWYRNLWPISAWNRLSDSAVEQKKSRQEGRIECWGGRWGLYTFSEQPRILIVFAFSCSIFPTKVKSSSSVSTVKHSIWSWWCRNACHISHKLYDIQKELCPSAMSRFFFSYSYLHALCCNPSHHKQYLKAIFSLPLEKQGGSVSIPTRSPTEQGSRW